MLDSILCFLLYQSVWIQCRCFGCCPQASQVQPDYDFEDVTPIDSFIDSPSDPSSEFDHVTVARFDVPEGGMTDIASSLADQFVQPSLRTYPKRKFGTRDRVFQKETYLYRNRLEYSQTVDTVFFYCYRAFRTSNSSVQQRAFRFGKMPEST